MANILPEYMFFRILAVCITLTLCGPLKLTAGVSKLAEELPAKVLYLEVEGGMRPVVGVASIDKVQVLMPGGKLKTSKYKSLAYAEKKLRPIGRLTLCSMEAVSTSGSQISGDVVFNVAHSNIHLELVADRPLKDVYAVVSYHGLTRTGQDVITMGRVGDIVPGELVKRDVFLQSVAIPGKTRYHVDFYSQGQPIEVFRLPSVAETPYSKSLLIPWELRLASYLQNADKDATQQPKPFHMVISDALREACRVKGVQQVDLIVHIEKDGTVALDKIDGSIEAGIQKVIQKDVRDWLFFPKVIDGQPEHLKIKVPLRF